MQQIMQSETFDEAQRPNRSRLRCGIALNAGSEGTIGPRDSLCGVRRHGPGSIGRIGGGVMKISSALIIAAASTALAVGLTRPGENLSSNKAGEFVLTKHKADSDFSKERNRRKNPPAAKSAPSGPEAESEILPHFIPSDSEEDTAKHQIDI
jgi:hypothetical protein